MTGIGRVPTPSLRDIDELPEIRCLSGPHPIDAVDGGYDDEPVARFLPGPCRVHDHSSDLVCTMGGRENFHAEQVDVRIVRVEVHVLSTAANAPHSELSNPDALKLYFHSAERAGLYDRSDLLERTHLRPNRHQPMQDARQRTTFENAEL